MLSSCSSGRGLLRWLYGLGYHTYTHGVPRPIELAEWEDFLLELLIEYRFEELEVCTP